MEDALLPGYNDSMSKSHRKELKYGFIRKVLGIVSFMLLATTLATFYLYTSNAVMVFWYNPGIIYAAIAVYLIIVIVIVCCKNVARRVPINYILLAVLVAAMTILISVIATMYDPKAVLNAFFTAVVTSVAVTAYTLMNKVKMSVIVGSMIGILFALLTTVILFFITGFSTMMYTAICFLSCVIWAIFLMYDIKRISSKKYGLSHEDYIFAALNIYIDIVNLFLELLRLFGSR